MIGTLRFKSDVGTYDYTSPRPHDVTKAGSLGYEYDKNGNQNVRGADKVEHTPFFLPSKVQKGGVDTLFQYNADHQRVSKRNDTAGTLVHYVDGLFERRKKGATTEDRLTILGPERPIAIVSRTTPNGTVATRYLHVDALGSSDVISSSNSAEVGRYSYDAFGAPRSKSWNPQGAPTTTDPYVLPSQGYTGHEDDDDLGLVNMKGRIYDPKLGRMLQADTIVPHPWFGQSFNRYSYVYNNPLSRTDPSGHCPGPEAGCTPGQGGGPSLPIDVKLPNPFGGGSSWSGGNVAGGGGSTPAVSPPSRFDNDPQASGVGGRIYTNSPEDVAAEMSAFRAAMANNPDSYLSGERPAQGRILTPTPGSHRCSPYNLGCYSLLGNQTYDDSFDRFQDTMAPYALSLIPVVNAAFVLTDPHATMTQKVFAITSDAMVFAGPLLKAGGLVLGKIASGSGTLAMAAVRASKASQAVRAVTLYHGTDVATALGFLNGKELNAAAAATAKIDGPPAFFLATHIDDAIFYGMRRSGTVIGYRFSPAAVSALNGLRSSPMAPLGKAGTWAGEEVIISLDNFTLFNELRQSGAISVVPARF